ncbi:MAG: 3-dehydroquinate synthase [Methylacidiphilales bacterium]|nr:3-dehydroquinate synthase [Candidatus Methylacidiphilales bacterium]
MTTPPDPQPSLPPHRKVRVDLGPRAYDVLIGRGMLNLVGEFMNQRGMKRTAVLIFDQNTGPLYKPPIWSGLYSADWDFLTIDSGEQSKSLKDAAKLLSDLANKRLSRSGTVIAVGGGVIGDLAGFVAATYLRGINFVQVPTTLLAMVDSSVGGKTGVNLPEGKNLVGAFHQPKLVVADLDTLKTLPPREFSAGMAEVIKYGAIKDKALFDRVAKGVKPDDADLDEIVEKCVAIKARIVEKDEFETKGERALLNFGHTIGHAIEKATGYTTYLHGEAISLGMRAAAWLSVWQAGLPESDARRIESALTASCLPVTLKPGIDCAAILSALGNDKKVAADGRNRWVLLKKLGEATSGWELSGDVVEKAVDLLTKPI